MSDILSIIKISIRALKSNKMRSGLTMLGVIIGVSAVIAMLAVGAGAREGVQQRIEMIGSNLIMVVPGSTQQGGVMSGLGSQPTLSMSDAAAIKKDCSAVIRESPMVTGMAQVIYGNQNWYTNINGADPSILKIRAWTLSEGHNFNEQDIQMAANVCILGQTVVENLFGNVNPLGKVVMIENIPFEVIGTLVSKGSSGFGRDQDDIVFIPVTTAQEKLFGTNFPGMVNIIAIQAKSDSDVNLAQQQVEALLRQRHHLEPGQPDDFQIRNLAEFLQAAQQSVNLMTLLLAAIASISLIVGGIGIMNIMLVSVTERTREIGIRMAVGATTLNIRLQFLIEAVILSLIGSLIGILLGTIGSKVVSFIAGWPTIISVSSIIISLAFSVFVGIFFGFYPAYKASLLNPIEALRYE